MRRLIVAGALAAVLAVPAHAQQQGPSAEEQAEKRDKETLDRQYKNALKNVPPSTAQSKSDPWATMRSPSTPATQGAQPKR